jgi:hypothetical protein
MVLGPSPVHGVPPMVYKGSTNEGGKGEMSRPVARRRLPALSIVVVLAMAAVGLSAGVASAAAPTITSFSPPGGPVGTFVTITGTDFTGATSVKFSDNKSAPFTVDSSTQITAVVPSGATTGPISVTTPLGTATSATDFTVLPEGLPEITSFSPTFGPVGTEVTILGKNFTGTVQVKFNNKWAPFTVHSDTRITATVQSGSKSGPIYVTNAVGTAQSASPFTVGTEPPPPEITSFSPTSGAPGTRVTINGSGFTGATVVKFNLTSASFTVDSDARITATVPNGATTGPISVTTPHGTAVSETNFVVPGTPTVDAFSPGAGPWGSQVVITGENYSDVSAVRFNGVPASFRIDSAAQITATVPSGATTGPISVTNPKGTAYSADPFVIKHVRSITLTLTGSLLASGVVSVADGTAACVNRVPVHIQRRISGAWRIVGTTTSAVDGSYAVGVVDREGKYRARAPKLFLLNGDVCTRARSEVVFNAP